MFYPLKSTEYTWAISKRIFQTFRSLRAITQVMICLSLVGTMALVSLNFSIGWGVLLILFLWISLIDFIDGMIPDILTMGVLLTLKGIGVSIQPIGLISIIALLMLKLGAEHLYKKPLLGWGDVKLICVCLLFTQIHQLPTFLFVMGASGIVLSLQVRSKAVPFAPCIILGFIAVLISI